MSTMTWASVLSDQVISHCAKHNVTEVECEPMIRQLIETIEPEFRPSIVEVMMMSKRRLWNLSPLPF